MFRKIILIPLLAAVVIVGCSPKFSCQETVDGIRCQNITSVYQERVLAGSKSTSTVYTDKVESSEKGLDKDGTLVPKNTALTSADIVRRMENDESRPIRVPSDVIRMWIAPWEDQDGDLHKPEYIYCEITGKRGRWLFGEENIENTIYNTPYRGKEVREPAAQSAVHQKVDSSHKTAAKNNFAIPGMKQGADSPLRLSK